MLSDVARRVRAAEITPSTADDPAELGGYEIRGRLGQGGMGVVYLGATRSGRLLAIKVIHPERTGDSEFRTRFRREVSAATRVRSRRTAAVVDFDVEAQRPWLATEYVPGPTLAQAIAELGSLPEPAVRELATGLAEALDAIHREGLVHRDLKPANVLLGPAGPVLIDMGIVSEQDATSLTTTGMQPGTPQFMSPEQARGEPVTAATDVWSLGAVTYVAATGTSPFGTGRLATVTYRIVHEPPELDALPPGLRHLVGECLAKDPAVRPAAGAVLAALAEPLLAGPSLAEPSLADTGPAGSDLSDEDTVLRAGAPPAAATTVPDSPEKPTPSRTRRRVLTGLVAAGLVLAGGGGTAAVVHFMARDDAPAVTGTPQAEASAKADPSADSSPSPSSKKPSKKPTKKPSAKPESSPAATPAGGQDTAPARFEQGTVVIPSQVQVGQKVVAKATGWTPQPATTACLWSIGGVERDNLGSCTYTVALDDVGKAVQVRLTAARSEYAEAEVLSDATAAVPQPSVPRPSCSITLRPGEEHVGWLAHCGIEQDPNVTYTWAWVDIDRDETITQEGEAGYTVGPSMWIRGSHKGNRVTVTVTAQRAGYRSAEFSTTSTMPNDYVPAG